MAKPNVGMAYVWAILIFVFPMIGAVALVHSNRVAIHIQIRLRAQLTSAVYRKALNLSSRWDPIPTLWSLRRTFEAYSDVFFRVHSGCQSDVVCLHVERSPTNLDTAQVSAADRDWTSGESHE